MDRGARLRPGCAAGVFTGGVFVATGEVDGSPGCTAQIDGAAVPLVRADLVLRAVAVAPGPHEVVFAYDPLAVRLGVWVSARALIVGAALALGPLVCRRWRGVDWPDRS